MNIQALDGLFRQLFTKPAPAQENDHICSNCGDQLDNNHSNYQPVWSDKHDNIVCWWCSTHEVEPR